MGVWCRMSGCEYVQKEFGQKPKKMANNVGLNGFLKALAIPKLSDTANRENECALGHWEEPLARGHAKCSAMLDLHVILN